MGVQQPKMNTSQSKEARWKTEISRRLERGNGLEFTLAQFAKTVDVQSNDPILRKFLEELVSSAQADRIDAYSCPLCTYVFAPGTSKTITMCPACHVDYQEEGEEVVNECFYKLIGDNSRDIRWIIVIHGMNSRAPWQEEFSWQIASRLRYSAPVLIYKYGWATIDVLIKPIHRKLARQLGESLRIAIEQATDSQRPSRPDIIAHSFGTRLFSLVLEDPNFQNLKFGRVITAGSIVRPDFDWARHVSEGRLEAVLNHVGAKDMAVPCSQYTIPGAGPGGTVGYAAEEVLNVRNDNFGHSDFFVPENIRVLISNDGLWYRFLTYPLSNFAPVGAFKPTRTWAPACWPILACLRVLLGIIFVLMAPLSWLRRKFDP